MLIVQHLDSKIEKHTKKKKPKQTYFYFSFLKHHLIFGNITKKSESTFTASLIAEHVQCGLDFNSLNGLTGRLKSWWTS